MGVTQESDTGPVFDMYAKHFSTLSDNIAPPIASCLGDLVTLSLLGAISSLLINVVNTPIPLICVTLTILSATLCVFLVRRNSSVRDLIYQGWVPLFGAMVISCATGIVLDMFASRYQGFPLLAIVISGELSESYRLYFYNAEKQDFLVALGLYLSPDSRLLFTQHLRTRLCTKANLPQNWSWSR